MNTCQSHAVVAFGSFANGLSMVLNGKDFGRGDNESRCSDKHQNDEKSLLHFHADVKTGESHANSVEAVNKYTGE